MGDIMTRHTRGAIDKTTDSVRGERASEDVSFRQLCKEREGGVVPPVQEGPFMYNVRNIFGV